MTLKICVAPDSFKGSMTSVQAAEAIRRGIENSPLKADVTLVPIADGGEGTVDALTEALGAEKKVCTVSDPLGRPVEASFSWNDSEKLAVIETAAASGLTLLKKDELNPAAASTFGTGQLMKEALDTGAEEIVLGIGGSATVDGGAGFLQALGVNFYDKDGKLIELVTGDLQKISHINTENMDSRLKNVKLTIASDVSNPLLGAEGAVSVFGPQKGVKAEEIPYFEKGMENFAVLTEKVTGRNHRSTEGAGASGGFGYALLSYLDVTFMNGFDLIAEVTGMETHISRSDLVITGEGRVDDQTLYGKGPMGIVRLAEKYDVPVILTAGSVSSGFLSKTKDHPLIMPFSIMHEWMEIEEAMERGEALLAETAGLIMKTLECGAGRLSKK